MNTAILIVAFATIVLFGVGGALLAYQPSSVQNIVMGAIGAFVCCIGLAIFIIAVQGKF